MVERSACDTAAADGGGLLALWERDIADGLPTVQFPERGDIGVLEAMGMAVGAIFTGERWAVKGARTLHMLAPEQVAVLKVWRL